HPRLRRAEHLLRGRAAVLPKHLERRSLLDVRVVRRASGHSRPARDEPPRAGLPRNRTTSRGGSGCRSGCARARTRASALPRGGLARHSPCGELVEIFLPIALLIATQLVQIVPAVDPGRMHVVEG